MCYELFEGYTYKDTTKRDTFYGIFENLHTKEIADGLRTVVFEKFNFTDDTIKVVKVLTRDDLQRQQWEKYGRGEKVYKP